MAATGAVVVKREANIQRLQGHVNVQYFAPPVG